MEMAGDKPESLILKIKLQCEHHVKKLNYEFVSLEIHKIKVLHLEELTEFI